MPLACSPSCASVRPVHRRAAHKTRSRPQSPCRSLNIRMDMQRKATSHFLQKLQKVLPVPFVTEDRLPVIPAGGDVIPPARHMNPQRSCHASEPTSPAAHNASTRVLNVETRPLLHRDQENIRTVHAHSVVLSELCINRRISASLFLSAPHSAADNSVRGVPFSRWTIQNG